MYRVSMSQKELSERMAICEKLLEGKLLELNLIDAKNHCATEFATNNSLALNSQKKNEIIWYPAVIKYIVSETTNDINFQSDLLLGKFARIKKFEDCIGQTKYTQDVYDLCVDEFFRMFDSCQNNETKILFYHKLSSNNLLDYAKAQLIFNELHILATHDALNKELPTKDSFNQRLKI